MNRRSFLAGLGVLIGGVAVDQAIPFNRVWSFPSEIKLTSWAPPVDFVFGKIAFVRCWEPSRSALVTRLDVLYGFPGLTS